MPKGIYQRKPRSSEYRKNLSLSKLGENNPSKRPEVRLKMSLSKKGKPSYFKGRKRPNLSNKLKGKKRPPFSEEWKRRISLANKGKNTWSKGRKLSEEQKTKMRLFFSKNPSMLGKKHSEETKRKIGLKNSITMKGQRIGEKHPNWQGGISFEPYSVDWTETLKKAIRERDKYTCTICGSYGLDIHHTDYNKKNCNTDNLVTLCRSCHIKTNYNRDYWLQYFKLL